MSKIMLPNQNSKFWGYDLNNYLLSLNSKIESLESMVSSSNNNTNSISAQFNGFSFNGDNRWKYERGNNTISGECVYSVYTSGKLYSYTRTFNAYSFLDKIYIIRYNSDNKLSVPGAEYTLNDIQSFDDIFYAVYLYFEREDSNEDVDVKTLFCPDYIFREDCVMIGTYEKEFGFIPRVQSSGKTLYQNAQDTVKSYATVVMKYENGEKLPEIKDFNSFVFHSNGIGAYETLSLETSETKDKFFENNTDVKNDTFIGKKIIGTTTGEEDKIILYYLSPSGYIYTQVDVAPPITTTVKDYNIESSNPLSQQDGYRAGGLVFLGAVVNIKEIVGDKTNNFYQWIGAKQNGVSPIISTIDNENFNNILIENNKYWVREEGDSYYYRLSLTPYVNSSDILSIVPKRLKNDNTESNIDIKFPSTHFKFGSGVNFYNEEDDTKTISILNDKISIYRGETTFELGIDNNNFSIGTNNDNKWIFNGDGCFETNSISINTINLSKEKEGILKIDSSLNLTGDAVIDKCLTIKNTEGNSNAVMIRDSSGLDTTLINDDGISTIGLTILDYYFDRGGNIKCNNIEFTSDIRLKTNLKPIDSKICYDAVQKLNVNKYTYIKNNYNTLGLIAQEIEEYLPEYANLLVSENEEGEKMVSEHKLLFILWEALKYEISERKKMGGK